MINIYLFGSRLVFNSIDPCGCQAVCLIRSLGNSLCFCILTGYYALFLTGSAVRRSRFFISRTFISRTGLFRINVIGRLLVRRFRESVIRFNSRLCEYAGGFSLYPLPVFYSGNRGRNNDNYGKSRQTNLSTHLFPTYIAVAAGHHALKGFVIRSHIQNHPFPTVI